MGMNDRPAASAAMQDKPKRKEAGMNIILKEGEYTIHYTPAEARQAQWDKLRRMAAEMKREQEERNETRSVYALLADDSL